MRVIHIGNMVGDSYLIVKALRRHGIDAELVIDRKAYVMEHPQWTEGRFEETVDEWAPDWSKIRVNGFEMPSWVRTATLRYVSSIAPRLRFAGIDIPTERIRVLRNYNRTVRNFDIVQACYLEPINCFLSPIRQYIAFSKGSDLREVPFEGGLRGKLTALAYKNADKVFVTNPDTLDAVQKLRISKWTFVPFIIDGELYSPKDSPVRKKIMEEKRCSSLIFAPARHDWAYKENDKLIEAFAIYLREFSHNALLILVYWGIDKDRSQQLIQRLGIANNVLWIQLMNRYKLVEYYNAADIIFDHLGMPSFGTTQLEGLACGKPVIVKLPRKDLMEKCYSEMPPFLHAETADDVLSHLVKFGTDRGAREHIGELSRKWVRKYHDVETVVKTHIESYEQILGN